MGKWTGGQSAALQQGYHHINLSLSGRNFNIIRRITTKFQEDISNEAFSIK